MSDLVRNERTRLTANALDRASTACITVGVFGPMVALLYGISGAGIGGFAFAIGTLLWLTAAGILHAIARVTLGRLK